MYPGRRTATGPAHTPLLNLRRLLGTSRTRLDHLVDQAEIPCFLGGKVRVALELALDRLDRLAGMPDVDFVQPLAERQDLPGLDLNIGRLPLGPTGRLVHHHAGIRQRVALALGARA